MPTNPLLVISYTSPNLNRQYQTGKNTNQNQKKNTCSFYTIFLVLEVRLITIYKIQPLDLLFFLIFIRFYINRYHFSQIFTRHSALSERKIFVTNFPFLTESLKPPSQPHPLKQPKSTKRDKGFLLILPNEGDFVQYRKSVTHHLFISYLRKLHIIIYIHNLFIYDFLNRISEIFS